MMPHQTTPPSRSSLNYQDLAKMTEKERLIAITTHNIQLYGSSDPPPEALYAGVERTCRHCGKTKKVIPDFSLSVGSDGKRRPNSWCTKCRTEARTHKLSTPRDQKLRTPSFSSEFKRAMSKHQRTRYIQIYNEIAEELGKETIVDPVSASR